MTHKKPLLNDIELQIIRHLAEDKRKGEIPKLIFRSYAGVDKAVCVLKEKSGKRTLWGIVAWAIQNGYYKFPDQTDQNKFPSPDSHNT